MPRGRTPWRGAQPQDARRTRPAQQRCCDAAAGEEVQSAKKDEAEASSFLFKN